MGEAMTDTEQKLGYRKALEALRSGVPSREAVRILGSNQPKVESKFQALLDTAADHATRNLLISGEFGTGKSHMLERCKYLALSNHYVCSMLAVSKETPFYKLDHVCKSSIDNGVVPGTVGRMVVEIAQKLDLHSDKYADFSRWANSEESGLHTIFPATLVMHEKSRDLELCEKIESFWSGDRITQTIVKDGLKKVGEQHDYQFNAPKAADLPPQRLRFVLELIKAAGYKGWVVLVDELELIGSYSILQRLKSYAELARWMGLDPEEQYPGMVVVGAITEDFESAVINGKGDRNSVPDKLKRDGDSMVERAKAGIHYLSNNRVQLEKLSNESVQESIDKLQQAYSIAYNWEAPRFIADGSSQTALEQKMRYKVRAAICRWDVQRLYPNAEPDIKYTENKVEYVEDEDLSKETSENDDDEGSL